MNDAINSNTKLTRTFYKSLYRIRRVEEEIIRIYPSDKIKSPVHLSIGQESVSVGACEALKNGDSVFGTYRGHAMYLAKGGDLKKMMAELYGKETGCAKGKGGSMHLIDAKNGIMGTSAIVASTIPLSAGYALGLQVKGADSIVVSFFGDGAVDEGIFHETMNFATLKNLPIIFVCENNKYAIHSYHLDRHKYDNIHERVKAYGMPSVRLETDDIFKLHEVVGLYADKARNGEGPAFIECFTCRWKEHVGINDDFHFGYRTEEEVAGYKDLDQVKKVRLLLDADSVKKIECEVEKEIKEAIEFAEESLFPKVEKLYDHVFKE